MARHQSLLSLILVIVAMFLASCGSPTAAKVPQTYTVAQIQQIQQYVPEIVDLRDRTLELKRSIDQREWVDVSQFIHGPVTQLRLQMTNITRHLLPKDQDTARQTIRKLFNNLVSIDQSAQVGDYQRVALNYQEALADINSFLQLLPQPTTGQQPEVEG